MNLHKSKNANENQCEFFHIVSFDAQKGYWAKVKSEGKCHTFSLFKLILRWGQGILIESVHLAIGEFVAIHEPPRQVSGLTLSWKNEGV